RRSKSIQRARCPTSTPRSANRPDGALHPRAKTALHQLDQAETLLAKAASINPDNSSAFELWAELKDLLGDHTAAARDRYQAAQHHNARQLCRGGDAYVHVSWRESQTVILSKFHNPSVVSFHCIGSPASRRHPLTLPRRFHRRGWRLVGIFAPK